MLTVELLQGVLKKKKYLIFDKNLTFNLNIVGIRSITSVPDKFDDQLALFYRTYTKDWKLHVFPITTDPGISWLLSPLNNRGTAILCEGQYVDVYSLSLHRGQYLALCQRNGDVKVIRDGNKNYVLDFDSPNVEYGRFGINIHRGNIGLNYLVGKFSAGCQVFQNSADFDFFIEMCKKSSILYGNKFTYTLINERDLF